MLKPNENGKIILLWNCTMSARPLGFTVIKCPSFFIFGESFSSGMSSFMLEANILRIQYSTRAILLKILRCSSQIFVRNQDPSGLRT